MIIGLFEILFPRSHIREEKKIYEVFYKFMFISKQQFSISDL